MPFDLLHEQVKSTGRAVPEKAVADPYKIQGLSPAFTDGLAWPSLEEMRLREIKQGPGAVQPINSTVHWIHKLLKPEWIPSGLENKLHLLRPGKSGSVMIAYDAIYLRYKVGQEVIQAIVTSESVSIVIEQEKQSLAAKPAMDSKTAFSKIEGTITKYLKESSKILNGKSWKIMQHGETFEGVNEARSEDWTDGPRWLTDGNYVYLRFKKLEIDRPSLPHLDASWFSSEPRKRHRSEHKGFPRN